MYILILYVLSTSEGFHDSDVIKEGSLGDGTVVHGHYDIDLIGIYTLEV